MFMKKNRPQSFLRVSVSVSPPPLLVFGVTFWSVASGLSQSAAESSADWYGGSPKNIVVADDPDAAGLGRGGEP